MLYLENMPLSLVERIFSTPPDVAFLAQRTPKAMLSVLDKLRRFIGTYPDGSWHYEVLYGFIDPDPTDTNFDVTAPSPLSVMTAHKLIDLVNHPTMLELAEYKWNTVIWKEFVAEVRLPIK